VQIFEQFSRKASEHANPLDA